jgi:hypothetical protein
MLNQRCILYIRSGVQNKIESRGVINNAKNFLTQNSDTSTIPYIDLFHIQALKHKLGKYFKIIMHNYLIEF